MPPAFRRLSVLLVFCTPYTFAQQPGKPASRCENDGTSADAIRCEAKRLEATEIRLNAAYRRLKESLRDDGEPDSRKAEARLIEAQRQWIKYRELDCEAVYLARSGGVLREWYRLNCIERHSEARIKQFELFRAD